MMMRIRQYYPFFTKLIIIIILLIFSMQCQATGLVLDIQAVYEAVQQIEQAHEQFIDRIEALIKQMRLQSMIADRNSEMQNNVGANIITRLSQNADELYYKKLQMAMAPALTSCSTNTIASGLLKNYCFANNLKQKITGVQTSLSFGGDPSKSYMQNLQTGVERVFNKQQSLKQQTNDDSAGLSSNTLLNAPTNGYSNLQEQEADLNRKMILGPLPRRNPIPVKYRNQKNLPLVYQQAQVNQGVYAARKNVAAGSLASIEAENSKGPNGVSKNAMINKFVQDRFLNKDWIEKITNTHPNKSDPKNITTEGQVLREIALMLAYNNYMLKEQNAKLDKLIVIESTKLSSSLDNNNGASINQQ